MHFRRMDYLFHLLLWMELWWNQFYDAVIAGFHDFPSMTGCSIKLFLPFPVFLRMALFFNCQLNAPVYSLNNEQMLIMQIVNTVLSFIIMVLVCITFSSNLQKAEKHLFLYNMELQQQAATDPLTTLYNRRRMEEILKNHIAANPTENFSIAIGDIDFFKKVNDTYGHNCGDHGSSLIWQSFQGKTLDWTCVQMGR